MYVTGGLHPSVNRAMVDLGAEMVKFLLSAHSSVGIKGLSHLINVGVGTRNNEVISIGAVEKIIGLGECGDKEVEWRRGYTCALKVPYPGMKRGG